MNVYELNCICSVCPVIVDLSFPYWILLNKIKQLHGIGLHSIHYYRLILYGSMHAHVIIRTAHTRILEHHNTYCYDI